MWTTSRSQRALRGFFTVATAVALVGANRALAYDLGCQYIWTEPSQHNDVIECLKRVPTDNGGILIPPIIPALFVIFMLLLFPIIFFSRCCCGAFGSNKIRPGADCCCDGDEWDEVPLEDKVQVYPKRHVCIIKIACLVVVALCVIPIIIMPIGGKYGVDFWGDFHTSLSNDVIEWAQDLKDGFIRDLTLPDGSLPAQMDISAFDTLQGFINDGRSLLKDITDTVDTHIDTVNNVIMYISFVPLVIASFMLVFILLSIRKILPAIFMWIYWFVAVIFGLVSIVMMVLGVVFVLMNGEVQLQNWKAPGVFQWYIVPYCEGQSMFTSIKTEFTNADRDQSILICRKFMDVCDDLPWSYPSVPGVSSDKPFQCSLTEANLATSCPTIFVTADLINNTVIKPGASFMCPNCTVGDCPSQCPAGDMRNATIAIAEAFEIGLKIASAVDRAFVYADCDVLVSQVIKPLQTADKAATGAFLAAAGTGFGALFLMFAIVLLCKGQKLFFSSPKKGYGADMDMAENRGGGGNRARRTANDEMYEMGHMSSKPVD